MIETFHVQNYKALRDVTLSLTPIHVLIGPNDSGKTSILEALSALCRMSRIQVVDAFEGRWEGADLVWKRDHSNQITLSAIVSLRATQRLEYSISMAFSPSNRIVATGVQSIRNVANGQSLIHQVGGQAYSVIHDSGDSRVAPLREALTGCQRYRWVPSDLALPVVFSFGTSFGMKPSGFGLAMYLNDIITYDHTRFGQLERRFSQLFPSVSRIRLTRIPSFADPTNSSPIDMGLGVLFEQTDGLLLPAAQASDGLLLVLAYLAILYSPTPPRVLLIEEPENGVHPQRLGEVLDILRELVSEQGRTQVLLTTHSPYVVDKFRPEEVTLCLKGPDGAVTTHRLSESKSVREQMDIFQLGEIWTAEGDEALAQPETPEEARMP
jgi:predicted ATPase